VLSTDGPPHVEVLGEEARGDHPDAVVHPALLEELAHAGVDDRVAGAPLAPGVDEPVGLGAGVVGQLRELAPQVVPGRVGLVPEDVGVELAPDQLGDVGVRRLRPPGRVRGDVGEDGARVDLAVLQRRRQPARRVEVGSVALLVVCRQPVVQERLPPLERGRLPGLEARGCVGDRVAVHVVAQPRDPLGSRRGCGSAVLVPRLGEGREDLVGRAGLVDDATRPHGIRRPGGDELAAVVGQRLLDRLVAAPAVGRRLARDVHLLGADLPREPGDDVDGVAAADHEGAASGLRQRGDRGEQPSGARGVLVEQPRVQDEDGQHVRGGVDGREQRGVVVQAQVAPEPQDRRRGRCHHEAAAAAPSRSKRTCATSR